MSSIANHSNGGAGGADWTAAGGGGDALFQSAELFAQQDLPAHQVTESTAEQSWAEFCMGLDKPAFLLPITGFAEL